MSKIDYTKEVKESIGDGVFKSAALIGTSYVLGANKPSLTATLKNFAIITGIIAGADMVYDIAKQKKWIPWL